LRTLHDLKGSRPLREVERAATEAIVRQLVTQAQTDRLLDTPPAPTRSPLEEAFLELVQRAGLPRPLVNHPVGPYLVDFAWRQIGEEPLKVTARLAATLSRRSRAPDRTPA
jgi:hypothetical protein